MKDKLFTIFSMILIFGLLLLLLIGIPYSISQDHETQKQNDIEASHMECKEYYMKIYIPEYGQRWQTVLSCERKEQ